MNLGCFLPGYDWASGNPNYNVQVRTTVHVAGRADDRVRIHMKRDGGTDWVNLDMSPAEARTLAIRLIEHASKVVE